MRYLSFIDIHIAKFTAFSILKNIILPYKKIYITNQNANILEFIQKIF